MRKLIDLTLTIMHFDEGEMIILDQTLEVCKVLSKFDDVSLIKCIESGG